MRRQAEPGQVKDVVFTARVPDNTTPDDDTEAWEAPRWLRDVGAFVGPPCALAMPALWWLGMTAPDNIPERLGVLAVSVFLVPATVLLPRRLGVWFIGYAFAALLAAMFGARFADDVTFLTALTVASVAFLGVAFKPQLRDILTRPERVKEHFAADVEEPPIAPPTVTPGPVRDVTYWRGYADPRAGTACGFLPGEEPAPDTGPDVPDEFLASVVAMWPEDRKKDPGWTHLSDIAKALQMKQKEVEARLVDAGVEINPNASAKPVGVPNATSSGKKGVGWPSLSSRAFAT